MRGRLRCSCGAGIPAIPHPAQADVELGAENGANPHEQTDVPLCRFETSEQRAAAKRLVDQATREKLAREDTERRARDREIFEGEA